jgi:transcriptional regulator with XRE-family HTH domain
MQPDMPSLIRDLRNRLNLSQEQLAQRLNVSFATINRWENGRAAADGDLR